MNAGFKWDLSPKLLLVTPLRSNIVCVKGILVIEKFSTVYTGCNRSWYTSANERFTKQSRTILMIFRPMSVWNRNIVVSLNATWFKKDYKKYSNINYARGWYTKGKNKSLWSMSSMLSCQYHTMKFKYPLFSAIIFSQPDRLSSKAITVTNHKLFIHNRSVWRIRIYLPEYSIRWLALNLRQLYSVKNLLFLRLGTISNFMFFFKKMF